MEGATSPLRNLSFHRNTKENNEMVCLLNDEMRWCGFDDLMEDGGLDFHLTHGPPLIWRISHLNPLRTIGLNRTFKLLFEI